VSAHGLDPTTSSGSRSTCAASGLHHFSDPSRRLAQTGKRESFRHAQVLAREGVDERDIFVVLEGKLHACRRTPIGTQVLATPGVGEIIGEISFIDHKARSSTILGVEAGTVLRFPAADLDRMVATNRDLGVALLWSFWHSLAAKVRAANGAMTEIITPGVAPGQSGIGKPGERVFLEQSAKVDLLREQGLSASELRLLATYSQEERFAPDTLIFGEGEHGDKLYIVVDGQVRISRHMQGMGEEALTILGRGEVFGEMALIDAASERQPRPTRLHGVRGGPTPVEEVLEMDPDAAHHSSLSAPPVPPDPAMNDRLVAWHVMVGRE
jgi:CRP-like cAMP-binding protein